MVILGHVLLIVGIIAMLVGDAMFLVVAYKRSLWWFFGCLFLPVVAWVFLFLNPKATIKPFGLEVAGLLIAAVGSWMAQVV